MSLYICLIEDLKKSLLNPEESFVVMNDPDEDGATKFITDSEMAQIKKQSERRDYMDESLRLKSDMEVSHQDAESDDDYADDYDPKVEHITSILTVIAGLIICGVIIFFVGKITGMFGFGANNESTVAESTVTERKATAVLIFLSLLRVYPLASSAFLHFALWFCSSSSQKIINSSIFIVYLTFHQSANIPKKALLTWVY